MPIIVVGKESNFPASSNRISLTWLEEALIIYSILPYCSEEDLTICSILSIYFVKKSAF